MKSYEEMIRERREMLKSHGIEHDEWEPHQRKGIPPPPLEKPYQKHGTLVHLAKPSDISLGDVPLAKAVNQRQSRRKFTDDSLTLEELSFLLWSTQESNLLIKTKYGLSGSFHQAVQGTLLKPI